MWFWSIESNFQPIENRSKRFFLKQAFSCVFHFFKLFKKLFSLSLSLSLSSTYPNSSQIFVVFLPKFSQDFCPIVPIRPLYPFFFSLFTFSMNFSCIFREIFGPIGIWGFLHFKLVSVQFDQWVFVLRWCKHVSIAFILINLVIWEQFEILGLVTTRIWGFCSIGLNLVKLTCEINWLCHYMMISILCND